MNTIMVIAKMIKVKTIFFFLVLVIGFRFENTYSQTSVEARREKLIGVIDAQLAEITRLNKRMGSQNPDNLLRMAELLLEKARLIKEQENIKFLALEASDRAKVKKNIFFKTSNSYFTQAQKTCATIIKRFPNYKNKGDVFYIMAYNAKEFGENEKAQKYFTEAVKTKTSNKTTDKRAMLALADIYFNKSEFDKTIPLYEEALKNTNKDKWWTKDSYNLAWSYFRTKQPDKAISKMEEVLKKSKDPNYVDMSFQVERDLTYFYAESNRLEEAVRFYQKNKKDVTENLIKMAGYLTGQGNFATSERILNKAKKHKKKDAQDIEIHLALLALYERNNQYEAHLESAKVLKGYSSAGKLNKAQEEAFKYQAQKMSSLLQKQVVNREFKNAKKIHDRRTEMAAEYFSILGSINPNESYKTSFHKAELYYANGDFNRAVELYDEVIVGASAAKDDKILKLANNGMMAALGASGVSGAIKNKYTTRAYIAYLKTNPKDEKSYVIYQRLFNELMDKKDIVSAEKILLTFKQNYPKDVKIQEAMLAKIMEHYKNQNNKQGLYTWVGRINDGDFKVSKEYASEVKKHLLMVQFGDVEKAKNSGDKVNALRGYVAIYKHPTSSAEAKKNAAYNVATLFYELRDAERMYGWAKRALQEMMPKDIVRYESSFLTFASELFHQRRFKESIQIYETAFKRLCRETTNKKKDFFKNAVIVNLSEGNFTKTSELLNEGERCRIDEKTLLELQVDYIEALAFDERWQALKDALEKYEKNKKNWPNLIYPSHQLAQVYIANGRTSEVQDIYKKMFKYYDYSKNAKLPIVLKSLDVIATLKLPSFDKEVESFRKVKLQFPENEYNKAIKQKIAFIGKMSEKALEIISIGSGQAFVYLYKNIIESYELLITEVTNFMPPGKGPAYIETFKKEMQNLTGLLNSEANRYRKEVINRIKKDKILSYDNSWFTHDRNNPFRLEYHLRTSGILMDRGGRK